LARPSPQAEHPEPYGQADVRLASGLASRAAVRIDNARLYTREHTTAVTLQRSLLPRASSAPPPPPWPASAARPRRS
jgi:hypothetical protein